MVLTVYLVVLLFICTGMATKLVQPPCDHHMFESNVDKCLMNFSKILEAGGYQNRCPWPAVKGIYNDLKHCVDDWAIECCCRGHGSLMDNVFLKVHQTYFSICGQVQDPPFTSLIMLISPVVIATLLLPFICTSLATLNSESTSDVLH